LVSSLIVAGLAVIAVGLLLIVAGLVMLVKAVNRVKTRLHFYAAGAEKKGPVSDTAELVKALNELIKAVGVARGVPLVVMILGVLLVVVGAGIITASA